MSKRLLPGLLLCQCCPCSSLACFSTKVIYIGWRAPHLEGWGTFDRADGLLHLVACLGIDCRLSPFYIFSIHTRLLAFLFCGDCFALLAFCVKIDNDDGTLPLCQILKLRWGIWSRREGPKHCRPPAYVGDIPISYSSISIFSFYLSNYFWALRIEVNDQGMEVQAAALNRCSKRTVYRKWYEMRNL